MHGQKVDTVNIIIDYCNIGNVMEDLNSTKHNSISRYLLQVLAYSLDES